MITREFLSFPVFFLDRSCIYPHWLASALAAVHQTGDGDFECRSSSEKMPLHWIRLDIGAVRLRSTSFQRTSRFASLSLWASFGAAAGWPPVPLDSNLKWHFNLGWSRIYHGRRRPLRHPEAGWGLCTS